MESVSQELLLPHITRAFTIGCRVTGSAQRADPAPGESHRPLARLTVGAGTAGRSQRRHGCVGLSGRRSRLADQPSGSMARTTAAFLHALFDVVLAQVVADLVVIGLLERFSGVWLEESTRIRVPTELPDLFLDSGDKASPATGTLFVRPDMLSRRTICSPLMDGRRPCAFEIAVVRIRCVGSRGESRSSWS